jgi:predicted ABC-type transport system involved in lysophospholipase L1 biosynthesis ATPase subunit
MLRCTALTKTYRSGGRDLTVLNDITFSVEPGGFAAIVGPSGSGKTTLLGLLAGLDRPTAGTVHLDGQELGALDEDARARMRGEKIGFVFQSFQLIPTLTAGENIQVPLELRGEEAGERAADLLERVGLAWATAATTTRPSSPAASSSGWRWPGPSAPVPRSSSPTSPPATSTPAPAPGSSISWCS